MEENHDALARTVAGLQALMAAQGPASASAGRGKRRPPLMPTSDSEDDRSRLRPLVDQLSDEVGRLVLCIAEDRREMDRFSADFNHFAKVQAKMDAFAKEQSVLSRELVGRTVAEAKDALSALCSEMQTQTSGLERRVRIVEDTLGRELTSQTDPGALQEEWHESLRPRRMAQHLPTSHARPLEEQEDCDVEVVGHEPER